MVYPVRAGAAFTPDQDGVFMTWALYQRTQRAVADRLLELRQPPAPAPAPVKP